MATPEETITCETLAPTIAKALGDEWSTQPDPIDPRHSRVLTGPNYALRLTVGGYRAADRGRAQITSHWPEELRPHRRGLPFETIGFSARRSPEQIATEIKRRLIPKLEEHIQIALGRKSQHDQQNTQINADVNDLLQSLAAVSGTHRAEAIGRLYVGDFDGPINGTIQTNINYATIELRLDPKLLPGLAKAIADLVRSAHKS